jgi:hypothetical protein
MLLRFSPSREQRFERLGFDGQVLRHGKGRVDYWPAHERLQA